MACENICNAVCNQIFLEQEGLPAIIETNEEPTTWIIKATNISGSAITKPVVVSTSLFGTLLLSATGMKAGETLKITATYQPVTEDTELITNTIFAAYGIPTTPPGAYNVGTRISSVLMTTITIGELPDETPVIAYGDVTILQTINSGANVHMQVNMAIENNGTSDVNEFDLVLTGTLNNCATVTLNNEDFVFGPINKPPLIGNGISLVPGKVIKAGKVANIFIVAFTCDNCGAKPECCQRTTCDMLYGYKTVANSTTTFNTGLYFPSEFVNLS